MKKINRFLLLLIAVTLNLNSLWAERVSQDDAAMVADHFMNVVASSAKGKKAPAKRMVLKKAAKADENQYYIYENASGEGWVMIAADDVAHPILAYSNTGSFCTEEQPANLKSWLNGYNRQIKRAVQDGLDANEEVRQEWAELRKGARKATASTVVPALIKTTWNQTAPYYNMCPQDAGGTSVTGCVATAMAQVMNYWKWPKNGTGSHSYSWEKCTSYKKEQGYNVCKNSTDQTLSVTFEGTEYDWDNMLNSYSGSSTSAQKNAVATLMYHVGVAIDMMYSSEESGAYTIDYNGYWKSKGTMCAETALKQFFGYNTETVKGYYRDGDKDTGMKSWTKSQWISMLKEELDAKRPIMYAGGGMEDPNDDDTSYGHSFVCDGYDTDNLFHFNWGWGGSCDGFYDVDALAPDISGHATTGAGYGEYNLWQDVIVGIQPSVTGHVVEVNGTGCTINPSAIAVENGNSLTATIIPTDETYDFTSIVVKLGSKTLTLGADYTLSEDKKSLTVNASAITGDIDNSLTITVVWTKNRYKYDLLGENCAPEEASGVVSKNGALSLTILPLEGYTLANAACWDVEMDGSALTFGTDFTYDAVSGAFAIAEVTGDVGILAYGSKEIVWMANGEEIAKTLNTGSKLQLPDAMPEGCVGKVFVGWITSSSYASETTAPSFVADGDEATASTYYAVFATEEKGGEATWELVSDAGTLKAGDILVIASNTKGKTAGDIASGNAYMSVLTSTFASDKKTITSLGNGTVELTLGGSAGAWTLSSEGKKLGATAAKSVKWDDGTTTWTINISSNNATIQNGTSSYGRFLHNASNNPRFTTYTSDASASMLLPQLYRKMGGASYSAYTTSCVPPTYYNIAVSEAVNGSIATTPANKAVEGATITVTATPAAHYELATLTVLDAENKEVAASGSGNVRTFTMPASNVTVSATFGEQQKYMVNFYADGSLVSKQDLYIGESAEKPADPEGCSTYSFAGWAKAEQKEETTTAPTFVNTFVVEGAQDYYAIYERTEEAEGGASFDGSTPGKYKIYAKVGTTKYYASTMDEGGKLLNTTNESEASDFNFEKSGDNFTIKLNGLYVTYTSNTNLGTSGTAYEWKITSGSKNGSWRVTSVKTTSRVIWYSKSAGKFGGYSTQNSSNDNYYDLEISGGKQKVTYYTSSIDCGGSTPMENTRMNEPTAQKAVLNGQIVIIRGDAVYSITGARIQ